MKIISSETAGKSWVKVMSEVYNNGYFIKDGDFNLKEVLNVLVNVGDPCSVDKEIKEYGDVRMIDWMKENFLSLNPIEDWGYSYGQRMYDFNGYNQFNQVAEKLINNPETKSAIISFMYPGFDDKHIPCIVALDFKMRNNKLNGSAFFRSQDAGKKFYADIMCMGEIMKRVSEKVKVPVGELNIFIASLHIYEQDFKRILDIIKHN
jgi:thymidylate synthase